jgi:polar amino acid transport system substrate-binding protein
MSERERAKWRATRLSLLSATALAVAAMVPPAGARSLDQVRARGSLGICAHPNALPFSSRRATPPGFQIELGRAIAQRLDVALIPVWIIGPVQIRRSDCDIALDTIAEAGAAAEIGLTLSKPYYHASVVLAVPSDSHLTSSRALDAASRVAVQVGSVTAMRLNQRGVPTSTFGFEDEMLQAVAEGEVSAAAVAPAAAGYYNMTHPDRPLRVLGLDDTEPELSWNVSVGLLKPDEKLKRAINDAIDQLSADGTIARIYGTYGIVLQAPR